MPAQLTPVHLGPVLGRGGQTNPEHAWLENKRDGADLCLGQEEKQTLGVELHHRTGPQWGEGAVGSSSLSPPLDQAFQVLEKGGHETHTLGLGTRSVGTRSRGTKALEEDKLGALSLGDRRMTSQIRVCSRDMTTYERPLTHCRQAKDHACCTQKGTQTQTHTCSFVSKMKANTFSFLRLCHPLPALLSRLPCLFLSLSLPGLPRFISPSSMAPLPTQLPPASQWAASSSASYVPFGPMLPSGILAHAPLCRWHGSMFPPLRSSLPGFFFWLPPEPPAVPALALRGIGRK